MVAIVRFGLVLPIQDRHVPLSQLWEEVEAEAVAAEAAGFDAVLLPEFHQARGGSLTSPLLLATLLLRATTTVRVGTAVLALPLHHPAQVAEDVAMAQTIGHGRLVLGVGAGHVADHFSLFGVAHVGRGASLERAVLNLRHALTGGVLPVEPVDVDRSVPGGRDAGRHTNDGAVLGSEAHRGRGPVLVGTAVVVPPLWLGAHGRRGLNRAGRLGDAWLTDPQRSVATVEQLAAEYRASADRAGRVPRVVLFRDGWIDDSMRACRSRWGPHALAVHRLYHHLGAYHRSLEPWVDEVRARQAFTFDRLAPDRFLVGDGSMVRATVEDWRARSGADMIAVRLRQPGGPGHQATLEAIGRFGVEVISVRPSSRSTSGHHAAVDHQVGAGDVGSGVGHQEHHR
jgi:alkanesulfonate monooxygenase SsuD/methylene tetrahydromethanopterin reductase-like flavin-dependent oxidoreductase (luciferase family)